MAVPTSDQGVAPINVKDSADVNTLLKGCWLLAQEN